MESVICNPALYIGILFITPEIYQLKLNHVSLSFDVLYFSDVKNGVIVKYMVSRLKGQNHWPAIVGPSVHNQRNGRVCADVYQVFIYVFHGLFKSMVAAGALDLSNAIQMYAFHFIFLPIKPKKFREMYNKHPLSIESIPDPWTNDMKNISLAADVVIHWSVKL